MTTLIEQLQSVLNPLAANGAWYSINTTEPPVYPYIVYTRISSSANVTLSGPTLLQNTRFQIDIWALQISQAVAIASVVDAALQASALTVVALTSQDGYDDQVRAFRIIKDYSIWSTN